MIGRGSVADQQSGWFLGWGICDMVGSRSWGSAKRLVKGQIFAKIQEFILVSVLKKAVLKLAGLFSPVGAVVQLVLTLWDVFQALREQFSRLMGVVSSVVEALGEIVAGRIDPAKQKIEDVLAALIPVAIGLFARLVGLGGLGRKVQEFIEAIRGRIERAVRRLILKIKARVQRMMRRRRSHRGDRDGRDQRPEAHGETSPEDERTHRRFAGEAKAVLEAPPEQSGDVIDFAGLLRQKRAEADRLEQHYDRRLENPVRMTIAIDQSQAVRERQIIPFEVRVAPNDTVMDGQAQIGSGAVNPQIENVHPWIREYVRKKAEDPALGPTNDWTRFVKRVGEQDPGIAGIHARPLIKDSSLPKDWVQKAHPWAAKGPVKKAVEQTYPKQEGNTSIASFFGSYKSQHGEDWAGWSDYLLGNFKGTIHNGEGIWRGAFHAMQEMIFDESKQQNAGQELAAAFVKRIEAGRSGGIPFEEELTRDEIVAALRSEASLVFDAEPDCIAMFAVAGRKMVSASQPGNEEIGRAH